MRKYGVVEVLAENYAPYAKSLSDAPSEADNLRRVSRDGKRVGLEVDGKQVEGFATPTRKLEFFSQTRGLSTPTFTRPPLIATRGRCSSCQTSVCPR